MRLLENALHFHRAVRIQGCCFKSCGIRDPGETPQLLKEVRLKPARPVLTPNLPTSCGHEEARGSPAESEGIFNLSWVVRIFIVRCEFKDAVSSPAESVIQARLHTAMKYHASYHERN